MLVWLCSCSNINIIFRPYSSWTAFHFKKNNKCLIHEFKFDIPIIRNVDNPMSTCHLYILINNLRIIPSDSQILTKRGRNKTIVVMVDPSCIQFYLYLSWTVVCVRKLTQLCSTPVGFYSIFHIMVPFPPQRGTQNWLVLLGSKTILFIQHFQ